MLKINKRLVTKISVSIFAILVYLIRQKIVAPYVDGSLLQSKGVLSDNLLISVVARHSAGRYQNASIFALGMSPYITASMLCCILFNTVASLK